MEVAGLSARLSGRTDGDRTIITDPDTGHTFVPGETNTDRTIYNAVAMFCLIALAVFLGEFTAAPFSLMADLCIVIGMEMY